MSSRLIVDVKNVDKVLYQLCCFDTLQAGEMALEMSQESCSICLLVDEQRCLSGLSRPSMMYHWLPV